jgi:DNA-binding MarR family transcriptional regulator
MKTRTASAELRYRALLQLLRTADTLWNTSRLFFARWNLGPSQFNILNLLVDRPAGYSQIELGRLLIMHRSNVTGLVERLQRRGLVSRRKVTGDRRAYRVVLTPTGSRIMAKILPEYFRMAEEIWGRFPAARASRLAATLEHLAARAEQALQPQTHA